MRIPSLTMKNNYINSLHSSQKKFYDATLKSTNFRNFQNMSEDVALGLRAMKVRREISYNVSFQDNVKECQSTLKAAEDTLLYGISPLIQKGQFEKYLQACNGTSREEEYTAINTELKKMQEELLKNLNADFAGRYLYGGSQLTERPFSTDSVTGELMYKNVKVADINPADPAYADLINDPLYIDIGLSMKLDASGNPIPSTVFDRAINGLSIVGTGPDNIYDILGRMITSLENNSPDDALMGKMDKASQNVRLMITKIGADDNYLTFTTDRLVRDYDNLIERSQGLEFVEPESALMEFKMQEFYYNAALQMGSRLLQPSLFNFLN